MCGICRVPCHVFASMLCVLLLGCQGSLLNYYLASYLNSYWLAWIAADIAVLFVFIVAFIISYRHFALCKTSSSQQMPIRPGNLPLSFIAWIIYAVALSSRVGIIFSHFAWQLTNEITFGSNMLKLTIGLAAPVFILLVLNHHNAERSSDRKRYISDLTATIPFDMLDTVEILDVLFVEESKILLPFGLDTAIVTVACINLVLPTIPMILLSQSHFGFRRLSECVVVTHKVLLVFIVNLPYLILRVFLWQLINHGLSIFILKNILMMFLAMHDVIDVLRCHGKPTKKEEALEMVASNEDRLEETEYIKD